MPGPASATNPLTPALIEHLSKEIEAQVSAMTAWRTRVNFTAYFGPWIILGAYFALERVAPCAPDTTKPLFWISLVGLVFLYLALGQCCARVEAGMWDQCNEWRGLIARLHAGDATPITAQELAFPNKLQSSYWIVYLFMLLAFVAGTHLIGACTQLIEPPNKGPAADSVPLPPGR